MARDTARTSYPYYLRIMRVAARSTRPYSDNTLLPESEQKKVQKNTETAKSLRVVADGLKDISHRATLAVGSKYLIEKSVKQVSSELKIPALEQRVGEKINLLFGEYSKYTDRVKQILDPIEKGIRAKEASWVDGNRKIEKEINTLVKLLKTPGHSSEAKKEAREKISDLRKEFPNVEIDQGVIPSLVKRLPPVLDKVEKLFSELSSAGTGDIEKSLGVEIKKREKEVQDSNSQLKKEESYLYKLKESIEKNQQGVSPEELERVKKVYTQRFAMFRKNSDIVEFKVAYLQAIKKAQEMMPYTIKDQSESAIKDIGTLKKQLEAMKRKHEEDNLPPMHPMSSNESKSSLDTSVPKDVNTKSEVPLSTHRREQPALGKGELPPMHPRGKVGHIKSTKLSSVRKRLSKVAKRLLILDYLRHKSL